MKDTPAPKRYHALMVGLHWLMAVGMIGLLTVGWIMGDLDNANPMKFRLFQLHKSFGLMILVLGVVRLIARAINPPLPMLPARAWEKLLARCVHVLLYGLMIAMPVIGWMGVSASPLGIPTVFFGLVQVPNLPFFQGVAGASSALFDLHGALAWGLAILIGLHAGAGVFHHWLRRDDVLLRMVPRTLHRLFRKLRGENVPTTRSEA